MSVSKLMGFSVIAIVGAEALHTFWTYGMGFQSMVFGLIFLITVFAVGSMLYIFWDVSDDWPHD